LPISDPSVPIRDAATVILVRDAGGEASVLMGQRGRTAAFLPEKYVFPGGAVDADDQALPLAGDLDPSCRRRLAQRSNRPPEALAAAAIREVWEETGLRLGRREPWEAPQGWESFAETGLAPDVSALRFFFRAVTPPGRPRRFDARFFLADAGALSDDPDDFSRAEDELRHLHWVALSEVRRLDLPFVTRIVLGELAAHLPRLDAPDRVAFVTNDVIDHAVVWL
jgi:8-oxo-dGTP pyrophosphatase MutT (NUDIX family)